MTVFMALWTAFYVYARLHITAALFAVALSNIILMFDTSMIKRG